MNNPIAQRGVATDKSEACKLRSEVCAVRVRQDDLTAALERACAMLPELFPPTLPPLVVIKPNLCDITSWETGATTDPRWLDVLAAKLRSIRSDVVIRVIESDAVSAYKNFRSCDETYARLGYTSVAEAAGIELVNLSRSDSIQIRLDGVPFAVRVPELLLEEMYFISIANLKVHPYTRMTGILKNSLGLLSDADISPYHPYLTALIRELHRLCPPDLCIIDGRIGLEGKGPILGEPVRMDTLLIGADALATDEAACRLMKIPPARVPSLVATAKRLGRKLESTVVGDFRPAPFAFRVENTHEAILIKSAMRRFLQRADETSSVWIERGLRFKRNPLSFLSHATFGRLARRRQSAR